MTSLKKDKCINCYMKNTCSQIKKHILPFQNPEYATKYYYCPRSFQKTESTKK